MNSRPSPSPLSTHHLGLIKEPTQIPICSPVSVLGLLCLVAGAFCAGTVPFPRVTWFLLAEGRAHFWLVMEHNQGEFLSPKILLGTHSWNTWKTGDPVVMGADSVLRI